MTPKFHIPLAAEQQGVVAERAATIGASPDGQAETIAGATQLEPLPAGHLSDRQVLKAISDRLGAATTRTRERIDRVAVVDPITCDMFVNVAGTLEKQLWMIHAQIPASEASAADELGRRMEDENGASGS